MQLTERAVRRYGLAPMRQLLLNSLRAAVAAADPLQILAPHLPHSPKGPTFVPARGSSGETYPACYAPLGEKSEGTT